MHRNLTLKPYIKTLHTNLTKKPYIQTLHKNLTLKPYILYIETLHTNLTQKPYTQTLHTKPYIEHTLTKPVLLSRLRCMFLISPKSANLSLTSSSRASSLIFVTNKIHPSTANYTILINQWSFSVQFPSTADNNQQHKYRIKTAIISY